ncbi:MAG TPA: alpha/beta hydrolase [Actinomycetes bacterium]|nr:alpha/beta hydrolase [Actinomycetes bacterium]
MRYDPFIWPEWAEVLQQLWELTSPEAAAASLQAVKARLGVAFQQCEPWPGWDKDHYDGPWNRTTANPVLVVGNLFDPATPYHGAVTVDRLLPRSRLLTLAGWGHTSLFASACVDAHVSAYLLTTQVPSRGAVCEPDVVPFAEPAAAAQTLQAGGPSKAAVIPPLLRRLLTD